MTVQRRRRVILLKFRPDVPDTEIDTVLEKIHENFTGMPGLRDLEMGPQTADLSDFTHAITFVLDDEQALQTYREDAKHQALRADYYDLLEATVTAELQVG